MEAITEKNFKSSAKNEKSSELTLKIRKDLKASKAHLEGWRKEALTAYDFFAGNQWSQEDAAKLREQGRPTIVFNRTVRVVNAVAGLEVQNRQKVAYTPREMGDAISSELLTGAADWVRENCDAEDEESQAFKDCLICGIGWTETRLDYETDPDGAVIIERVDPLEMLYDPTARKRNLDDMRWVARVRQFNKDEFKQIWPDAEVTVQGDVNSNFWGLSGQQPIDVEEARFYRTNSGASFNKFDQDKIDVIQYQYWEREAFYRVDDGAGNIEEISEKDFKRVKPFIEAGNMTYLRQTRRKYKQAFVYGNEILEEGDSPISGFTFRPMTGLTDRNNNTWFGLLQLMHDPQMYANKWLSQILYIINSNAKGGYMYESGALKNPRAFSDDLARPDKNVELNPGGMDKVQLKPQPQYPSGIDRLLSYAVESVNELVGVNLEMLGVANRDQAAILEMQRKQAGVTVLADFFDALRRYRKEQGRVLADFILEYISDGRLIRISGGDLGKYVPLMKESLNFKYDIAVDETPTSPNQKERVFDTLVALVPQLMQAGIPIPPEILDYAPLPANLVQKWKGLIAESGPSELEQLADEIKVQLAELEVAKQQQGLQEQQAKTAKDEASAIKYTADAQKAQADTVKAVTDAELNRAKAQHELSLADLDYEKDRRANIASDLKILDELRK